MESSLQTNNSENYSENNSENNTGEIITKFAQFCITHPKIELTPSDRMKLARLSKKYKKLKDLFANNYREIDKILCILTRKENLLSSDDSAKSSRICSISSGQKWIKDEIVNHIEEVKKSSKDQKMWINSVEIDSCVVKEDEYEYIAKCLLSLLYCEFESLKFKGVSNIIFLSALPLIFFFNELREVVSRATKEILLESLELSGEEFYKLIRASKHICSVIFKNCMILSEQNINFGSMENCKIQTINIISEYEFTQDWRDLCTSLVDILQGVLNCNALLGSLKKIEIFFESGEDQNKFKDIAYIVFRNKLKQYKHLISI